MRSAISTHSTLRRLPFLPDHSALAGLVEVESGAKGTLQAVSPTSTDILPIFSAAVMARSTSGCAYVPSAMTKPFMAARTAFGC